MIGIEKIKNQIIQDEGTRQKLYKCPADKWTIGVGRNLEDNGLAKDEIEYLLINDIKNCYNDLLRNIPIITELNNARQRVLINMCFNLGITRLLKFKNMIAALNIGDYTRASEEMLDSKWAKQVSHRAEKLAKAMKLGED